jgi:ABC-type dipeptide/oligopeptide/nickel transport system ATPase component
MKLVGREVELGAISRAVAAVQGGDSRVLAIVGEAGIGKSALLEAVATAAGDLRVASGRAAEHERDLPFALAADALAPHTRELDPSIVAGDCPRRRRTPPSASGSTVSSAGSSGGSARSCCSSTTSSGPTTPRSS